MVSSCYRLGHSRIIIPTSIIFIALLSGNIANSNIISDDLKSAAADIESVQLNWQSDNNHVDALGANVTELVQLLHNIGQLPLKRVMVDEAMTLIEPKLRTIVPFLEWNDVFDNTMCDLNPRHCTRPRETFYGKDGLEDLTKLDSHVSGFEVTSKTQSIWNIIIGEPLWVPDLEFKSYAKWVSFSLPEEGRHDIRDIYSKSALGCDAVLHPYQVIQYTGTIEQFKNEHQSTSRCTLDIINFNQNYWSSILIQKDLSENNLNYQRAASQNKSRLFVFRMLGAIQNEANSEQAWQKLNSTAGVVYRDINPSLQNVSLPVLSLGATIDLKKNNLYTHESDLLSIGGEHWRNFIIDYSSSVFESADLLSKYVIVIPRLEEIVEPRTGAPDHHSIVHSTQQSNIGRKQVEQVFGLINLPDPDLIEDNGFERTIIIADNGLNINHCVFSGNCQATWVDQALMSRSNLSILEKELVDNLRSELNSMQEFGVGHGHGIAAIAAAKPESGVIYGIDPKANPILFDLNLTNWPTDNFDAQARDVLKELRGSYAVWNFSGHTRSFDLAAPIERFLKASIANGPHHAQYMVFASGNIPIEDIQQERVESDVCHVFPACRTDDPKLTSVITVVGAMVKDGNVVPWRDDVKGVASYTHPSFEIAAIADNVVVPSLSSPTFYSASGTSYAAPQVSAVLLLLRTQMASASLSPEVSVGRVVGCGKMWPDLVGHVMGGLLDVECTLQFDKTQVAYRTNGEENIDPMIARELRPGKLQGVWTLNRDQTATIQLNDGNSYRWWPEVGYNSIIGFRQFENNPEKYNITTWDDKGLLKTSVREFLSSNLLLEIRFDGDSNSTCILANQLIDYIPGAPGYAGVRDQVSKDDSECFPE